VKMPFDMIIGADFFLSHRIYVASSQHKLYFTYNGAGVQHPGNLCIPGTPCSCAGRLAARYMTIDLRLEAFGLTVIAAMAAPDPYPAKPGQPDPKATRGVS
jgi:hypothetical protein